MNKITRLHQFIYVGLFIRRKNVTQISFKSEKSVIQEFKMSVRLRQIIILGIFLASCLFCENHDTCTFRLSSLTCLSAQQICENSDGIVPLTYNHELQHTVRAYPYSVFWMLGHSRFLIGLKWRGDHFTKWSPFNYIFCLLIQP